MTLRTVMGRVARQIVCISPVWGLVVSTRIAFSNPGTVAIRCRAGCAAHTKWIFHLRGKGRVNMTGIGNVHGHSMTGAACNCGPDAMS